MNVCQFRRLARVTFGLRTALTLVLVLTALPACYTAQPPPKLRVLDLAGTPYQRGVQHGKALSSEIRSFYTTMLTTSLLPYLNREQPDISTVLKAYDPILHTEYGNSQFSLRLLTDSALAIEKFVSQDHRDEMHGIADGAQVPYQQVLLLNTFVDSTLATRAVAYYLRTLQAPKLNFVELQAFSNNVGDLVESDGIDNDGDGKTDESKEGRLDYAARPTATFVEVPVNTHFRLMLEDSDGVDPASVRVQTIIDGQITLFTVASPELKAAVYVNPAGIKSTELLEVILKLNNPLPKAAVVTLGVQASDAKIVANPPPAKARTMRIEQITFTTVGAAKAIADVPNLGVSDGTTSPTSLAFAVRNSATVDAQPLMANHFTLLDAGTSHKHCVLQIHRPVGKPPYAFLGWAGVAYGLSGVSSQGIGIAVTQSDTLNNSIAIQFEKDQLNAKLVTSGMPVGFAARTVLEQATSAVKGAELLLSMQHTFGWNFLIGDAQGELRAVEVHSAVHPDLSKPVAYGPNTTTNLGVLTASVGPDDLAIGAHFRQLATDIDEPVFAFLIPPQRAWSTYYYPSLRTQATLQASIKTHYGKLTVAIAKQVLRVPTLVDRNDSMQATVIEPAKRTIHAAAGNVPATDGEFTAFSLPPWPAGK